MSVDGADMEVGALTTHAIQQNEQESELKDEGHIGKLRICDQQQKHETKETARRNLEPRTQLLSCDQPNRDPLRSTKLMSTK